MFRLLPAVFFVIFLAAAPSLSFAAEPLEFEQPAISGGAEATSHIQQLSNFSDLVGSQTTGVLGTAAYGPGVGFDAYNFDDNATETGGFVFIPPDPIGAAGTDRLISVVNVGIECRNKAGTLLFRDSLKDFFSPLGASALGTFTFDPKVIYDHYENRFVVVTLERTDVVDGAASDASRILVAVSKTATPATATAADWWYHAIDSKITVGATQLWADYPGLEIDEEVIYITMNYFNFKSYGSAFDHRLWIVHKGAVGGFYAGSGATVTSHDAYTAAGVGSFKATTMSCEVHGAGGVGAGIGTYLLSYGGLTFGGPAQPEAVLVIRVDNPTGAVGFLSEFVTVGDIEDVGGIFGFPALPDAPQSGGVELIEVNDRRALDAVWRNGFIYLATTINPNASDPVNQGTTTAHVFKLDATAVTTSASPAGLIGLSAETNIGAEDVASGTYTFFPSVAVNSLGDIKVGFAGSASSIFGSALAAEINQTTFTPGSTITVRAGAGYYVRKFAASGGTRNRWGDYSGISVDPADGTTFWIFNEYAETQGTPIGGENGRWGTAWLSCVQQPTDDFGDAPPPYPTLLATNGARHFVVPNILMGALIDPEIDGIPHPNALGDDLTAIPDEDGVFWVTPLVPGQPAQVDVFVTAPGWVDVYIDVNLNGTWFDGVDLLFSGPVGVGLNPLPILVPAGALPGVTYARVRFNSGGPLPPVGPAQDGEVEDYEVFIEQQEEDFGDAPDAPYPTLLGSNGARHTINPNVFLGASIDPEPDGQPDPAALGDDLFDGNDDEDGVTFVTPLVAGQTAQIHVSASVAGWLDVWVDLDQNGSWFDPGELVYSGPVVGGLNPIPIGVPATALPGLSFMRVRYNLNAPLPPDGAAPDGEVEDYEVEILPPEEDFGDAPDPSYPTLLVSNGARHVIVPGVFMGNLIDGEPDGLPSPLADRDDLTNLPDEDGLTFVTPLTVGQIAQVDVFVSVGGQLDLWIDFNQNGSWFDPVDLVYSGAVAPGLNPIPLLLPFTALPGQTFLRARYNVAGIALPPDGPAPDGEVEDYVVEILPPDEDFGDAPDPTYPTLLASNGARHIIMPGIFMGAGVDPDPDGQPDATATGDDVDGNDDEDGVTFVTLLTAGQNAQIDVVVSVGGWLDVWLDYNANGSWLDPGEQLYSGPVAGGLNPIPVSVPLTATPGSTFLRARFNAAGIVLTPDGPAPDGEVEDHEIDIEPPLEDFGDAPDPTYPTLLASNGARHVIVPGVFMGALIDSEPDGQPDATATGDDVLDGNDDEDGVVLVSALVPGLSAQIDVTVSAAGWVDIWIDYNIDGTWQHPGELVFSGPVVSGLNPIVFTVPAGATPGVTFTRVRYNTGGALPPDGPAADGEVEDYEVLIDEPTGVPGGDHGFRFELSPGVPNPFSQQFTMQFVIPSEEFVELKVFTMEGRLVTTMLSQHLPAGPHAARWDGRDDRGQRVPSGIYFYRLQAGERSETRRVMYLR